MAGVSEVLLLQDAISGLGTGAAYALVALALVIVFRTTSIVNFAQGEMATFTTFISWDLLTYAGLPFYASLVLTAIIAALIGTVTYRLILHPVVTRQSEFAAVMLTFGLFELFNGLSNSLWSPTPREYPAPMSGAPVSLGRIFIERQSIADAGIALVVMLALGAWFRYTRGGLGMRATTDNIYAARAVGINVVRVYAAGWAVAGAIGAVSGMLLANVLLLSPNEMGNVIVFALVALIIGGVESPVGAVVGGIAVGVVDALLAGTPAVGPNLATPVMLGLMVAVLLVRPQGLFGSRKVRKL